jgi:tetratricopeptide (TPR) repeat protein
MQQLISSTGWDRYSVPKDKGIFLAKQSRPHDSGRTGEAAVSLASWIVHQDVGWLFRSQTVHDHGIDAHVESFVHGQATGRILALQIKGGPSYFRKETEGGWFHGVPERHAQYWLNHSLPVVVVLVNLSEKAAYWTQITPESLIRSGKSFKVFVPISQKLEEASSAWSDVLDLSQLQAEERFSENLDRLPPSCGAELTKMRAGQRVISPLMAAFLAAGSHEPAVTASVLMRVHLDWLKRSGATGCIALASFAVEHDAMTEASAAYELAAEFDPERRARLLALAALRLSHAEKFNRQRYADLLGRASALNPGEVVVSVCLAIDDPGVLDSRSDRYDRQLLERIRVASDDVLALALLASKAVGDREESRAIELYESCLLKSSHSSGVMVELARCYIRRSQTSDARLGDLVRATELAEKALDQRRKWTSETTEALIVLVRALGLQNRLNSALRGCLLPPLGTATKYEIADAEVARLAAVTARQLGKEDLIPQIISAISDVGKRLEASQELQVGPEPSSETVIAFTSALLESMTKPYDYELLVRRVIRLALLGIDRSETLQDGVVSGAVPPNYPDFIKTVALHARDPLAALKNLRVFAETEPTAAELLITTLAETAPLENAIAACIDATERFRNPAFIQTHLALLKQSKRIQEAEELAQNTLTLNTVTGATRTSFRTFLAEAAAARSEWAKAASLYEVVLSEDGDAPRSTAWNALACEANQDNWDAARSLVQRYPVDPSTSDEARLWTQIHTNTGWTPEAARKAIALAIKFADDRELASALIQSVITYTKGTSQDDQHDQRVDDQRPVVPGEIHARAFEVLETLIEKHGDALALKLIDVTSLNSPEELKKLFSPTRDEAIRELAIQVRRGIAPMGVLAACLREPYALLIAKRAVGVRVASSPDPMIHEAETLAAMEAINGPVTLDASTVELMFDLDEHSELRWNFSEIRVPQSARRDSVRAAVKARSETATVGSARWDETAGRLVLFEADPAEQFRVLSVVEKIDRLLSRFNSVEIFQPYTVVPDLSFEAPDSIWLDTLELAGRDGISLWSDDLALRSIARELGISAFGTVNLIEGLRLRRIATLDDPSAVEKLGIEQHTFVKNLLRIGVVDQPVSLEDLLEQIIEENGEPGFAAAVLSRPAWWHSQGSISPWINIRDLVRSLAPDHVRVWQRHAMEGIALSLEEAPAEGALMLAVVALMAYGEQPDIMDARHGLAVAAEVAQIIGLHSPNDQVTEAAAIIHHSGLLDDPGNFIRQLQQGSN